MELWQIILTIVTAVVTVVGGLYACIKAIANKIFDLQQCLVSINGLKKDIEVNSNAIRNIETILNDHNERFVRIETTLMLKHKNIDGVFTQRHSQKSLNTLGEKIFNEMDGTSFLNENKAALYSEIDKRHPKAALDVELFASIALAVCKDEDFFIPIKNYVYNCPYIETEGGHKIDMTIETACYLLSFPLRDMYLEDHPTIPH